MGKIKAVCISEKKGTVKHNVGSCRLTEDYGLENDAHAGKWHRQVSLLSYEDVENFCRENNIEIQLGMFGENLLVSGINLKKLPLGSKIYCGECVLEVTQIGKECHSGCEIARLTGKCVMPKNGIFARVLRGGEIKIGDELSVRELFKAAVVTVSDRAFGGIYEDKSGPALRSLLENDGFDIADCVIVSDDKEMIKTTLKTLSDKCDIIITTGGTGLSPRDVTPEATSEIMTKAVPGISEAIRALTMRHTPKAMLSRGVSVIRNSALIINFPGSPKAVRECYEIIQPILNHALGTLKGTQDR